MPVQREAQFFASNGGSWSYSAMSFVIQWEIAARFRGMCKDSLRAKVVIYGGRGIPSSAKILGNVGRPPSCECLDPEVNHGKTIRLWVVCLPGQRIDLQGDGAE